MKKRTLTNRIVFHHSLSPITTTVDDIRQWHLDRDFEDIGYHYIITYDGQIINGRDRTLIGSHASGKNHDSIGACLIGDFRSYEPSILQLEASVRLYHLLCRSYSKSLIIDFHRAIINPCPGPKLDRVDFVEIVKRGDPYGEK